MRIYKWWNGCACAGAEVTCASAWDTGTMSQNVPPADDLHECHEMSRNVTLSKREHGCIVPPADDLHEDHEMSHFSRGGIIEV